MYDIYDIIEVFYRMLLFLTPCGALAYLMYTTTMTLGGNIILGFILTFLWLVFCIAIASYLLFVAKGSFRPAKKQEFMDTYHCFEYLQKQERK